MTSDSNPKVEQYIDRADKWRTEFTALRALLRECPLNEDFKWGHPCYTVQGGNVVLMHGFKEYCALLFHKGALMKDPAGILIQQGKNSQSARQLRFTSVAEIEAQAANIKTYVFEAIEIEKSGLKVELKDTSAFDVPEEFQRRLDDEPTLKRAFEALTPGRQRAYLLHIAGAKQAKTREARIDKCMPLIMEGKGLNDR